VSVAEERASSGVYATLREQILLGRHRPNQRLVEVDLCEQFGVSRTPVRQALLQLQQAGLVDSTRHGWVVHEHTEDEVRQIYQVRTALEGYAARLAALAATEDELRELAGIYDADIPTLVAGPRAKLVTLNQVFHSTINRLAHNPRLANLCDESRSYAFNYQLAATYSDEEMAGSLDMHRRMGAAIAEGKPDEAERLAREHIAASLDYALRRISQLV
jgi:DNA-binding GntR family transcriptional regulator